MANFFSMDDPDYKKHQLFDSIFNLQTYLNILFLLLHILFSVVFTIPLLVIGICGLILLPVYFGVPILNIAFIYSRFLTKLNNDFYILMLRTEIPKVDFVLPERLSQLQLFRYFAKQRRSWQRLFYFACQSLFGILSALLLGFLVGLTVLLVYTPVNAMFGHIEIFSFYKTDSFIEAVFVFFIGFILWSLILNLLNYWVKTMKEVTLRLTNR
jgi:Putative sensor